MSEAIEQVAEAVRTDRPLTRQTQQRTLGLLLNHCDARHEVLHEFMKGGRMAVYEIRVKGHLDGRWSEGFDEITTYVRRLLAVFESPHTSTESPEGPASDINQPLPDPSPQARGRLWS